MCPTPTQGDSESDRRERDAAAAVRVPGRQRRVPQCQCASDSLTGTGSLRIAQPARGGYKPPEKPIRLQSGGGGGGSGRGGQRPPVPLHPSGDPLVQFLDLDEKGVMAVRRVDYGEAGARDQGGHLGLELKLRGKQKWQRGEGGREGVGWGAGVVRGPALSRTGYKRSLEMPTTRVGCGRACRAARYAPPSSPLAAATAPARGRPRSCVSSSCVRRISVD